MVSEQVYKEGIEKLEGAYNYKIFVGALKLWKEELDDDGMEDKDYLEGIKAVLLSIPKFPSLYDLLKACRFAKTERLEVEALKNRKVEELAATRFWEGQKSDIGKNSLKIIKQILSGTISKQDYIKEMFVLDKKYPHAGFYGEAKQLEKYWGKHGKL